jgi:hypothetical protein
MITIATTPTPQSRRATCDTCGASLPPYRGLGKPRVRCPDCAADRSALGRAWRLANPEAVAAYNARRRTGCAMTGAPWRSPQLFDRDDPSSRIRTPMKPTPTAET